jgi:hypothetical protein
MGNLIDHGPWESPASSDSSSCVMKRFGFRKWPATAMAFMKAARRARSLPVQEDGSLCFTEWLTYDWKEARFGVPLLQPTAEHRISRITCIKSHSISQLRYSIISSSESPVPSPALSESAPESEPVELLALFPHVFCCARDKKTRFVQEPRLPAEKEGRRRAL